MKSDSIKGKLVVVTGGSSGIGLAVAESFQSLGADVLIVARNSAKLDSALKHLRQTGHGRTEALSVDVSNEHEVKQLQSYVRSEWGCADIVVNSAGIVSLGKLHETPIAEWDRLHSINVRGLVLVLQALIPDMVAANEVDGLERHIVNVASMAAYAGLPGMSAYGATKAAVVAISDSLNTELAENNIAVTSLAPATVKTPIAETLQLFGSLKNPEMEAKIERMFQKGDLKAETVAKKAVQAVTGKRSLIPVGREAVVTYFLRRLSPKLLQKAVTAGVSR